MATRSEIRARHQRVATVLGVLVLGGLLLPASSMARRECGRVSLPKGYSASVNINGPGTCSVARAVVRDNFTKRIRYQTGGTGRTKKLGFRCFPAHGDETECTRGSTTVFGYNLRRRSSRMSPAASGAATASRVCKSPIVTSGGYAIEGLRTHGVSCNRAVKAIKGNPSQRGWRCRSRASKPEKCTRRGAWFTFHRESTS